MHTPLNLHHRTEEELSTSLNQTLSEKQHKNEGVWLFVYGLLAKKPPFTYTRTINLTLPNWQRRFHLADPMNRGTPQNPGLTLGLHQGGKCEGVAYFIPPSAVMEGLTRVWEQEMLLPFYTPQWIAHDKYELLTMLTDLQSPALQPNLSLAETAAIIAKSEGEAGTNTAYLTDVINAFTDHGIEDPYLTEIHTHLKS